MNPTNPYVGPRPANLPAPLAAALAKLDTAAERHRQAERDLAALNGADREAAARKADDAEAVKAAVAGKTIPDPVALPTLIADRAKAERAVEAHRAALTQAVSDVHDARYAAAEAAAPAERDRRTAAVAALQEQADELAAAVEAEAAARYAVEWMRRGPGEMRQAQYASIAKAELWVSDIFGAVGAGSRPYRDQDGRWRGGGGPHVPASTVIRDAVVAALPIEEV